MSPLQYLKRPRRIGRGNYLSLHIGNLIATVNDLPKSPSVTINRYCISIQSLTIRETISKAGKSVVELIHVAPYSTNFDNQVELIVQKENLSDTKDDLALNVKI